MPQRSSPLPADGPRPLQKRVRSPATVLARLSFGLLALGIALRLLVFVLDFPVWRDEASLSLNFLERDYFGLRWQLNYGQIAPLFFLWIEKTVFVLAGPSEFWLRAVPVLAGIGGLVLFRRLAGAALPPTAAILAVGLLAVSWWPVELASSIKPYAVDLCVSVWLLFLSVGYLRRAESRRCLVLLAFSAPLAVGLSYPSVFVAGAASLVLAPVVLRKGLKDRGWFLVFNGLLAAAFLAQLLLVGRDSDPAKTAALAAYMRQYWSHGFPHGGPFNWLRWALDAQIHTTFSYPVEFNGCGLMGLALVVLGARSLARQGERSLVFLCLLPFALHFAAALMGRYPYGANQRLEQHLLPCFCLLAAAGLDAVIRQVARTPAWQIRGIVAGSTCLAVVGLNVAVCVCQQPYHDAEAQWAQRVGEVIRNEIRPGDAIWVRHSLQTCDVCLRWQLLPVCGQILEGPTRARAQRQKAGRLWIVDPNCANVPVGSMDPAPILPNKESDPLENFPDQNTIRHHRFRGVIPGESANCYRYLCDLYMVKPRAQGPATGDQPERSFTRVPGQYTAVPLCGSTSVSSLETPRQ
jgi:hypothetical protein